MDANSNIVSEYNNDDIIDEIIDVLE